ncbi:MAG: type II toxin-antitoxin system Phd/YefM family antitoxin [Candidatus Kuenenbacteria bacterium]
MNQEKLQTISAKKARTRFGELLDQAFYQGQDFLVVKKNKPMAVMIGLPEWNARIRKQANKKKLPNGKFSDYNMGKFKINLTREKIYGN